MKSPCSQILDRAYAGERISAADALALYDRGELHSIMQCAHELRARKTNANQASYTMFRVVNYTNFCNVDCNFCSFYEPMDSSRGYTLSREAVIQKMREALELGASQMFLQGGVNPNLPFQYYLDVLEGVKAEFGSAVHIRAFSPVELLAMEAMTGWPLSKVLGSLKDAGLDSVPGAGAEILTERMRKILSPQKSSPAEWARVMEECHQAGLKGSANIVFGSEETRSEVIEHLQLVRDIQDRSGGFLSFIPWTFQQQTKKFKTREVGAPEYLKVLGICRIFLDNIDHIETSIMVLGPGVGSIALHSGADDISSVVIEENVLRSYGLKSEAKAREFISISGFEPVQRDLLYNPLPVLA
ncbi:MAG: CofH family radical SAM protein [Leptospiraceae bacterium]|nr:CofH family radical SAM protein [Leptospiraceae bacterium]